MVTARISSLTVRIRKCVGGCPGNLLGLKSLVIGQNAHDVANKLANIPCGGKVTSCPDQLSKAINENIK